MSRKDDDSVEINTSIGGLRAKGAIDYETGVLDITWAPTDPVSELGDLVRNETEEDEDEDDRQ